MALCYDVLPLNKLKNIYNEGDVFLNSTCAEAFSIPCLEAMACGLPVITTNFGGQTDFVNKENGWLTDYELFEVKHEVIYEGIKWAKINLIKLREQMREAFVLKEKTKEKGSNAFNDSKNWTWGNSAQKVLDSL